MGKHDCLHAVLGVDVLIKRGEIYNSSWNLYHLKYVRAEEVLTENKKHKHDLLVDLSKGEPSPRLDNKCCQN